MCNYKGIIDFGFELPDCIRGDVPIENEVIYGLVALILLGLYFLIMAVSLVMVVISVFQTEMTVRRALKEREREQEPQEEEEGREQQEEEHEHDEPIINVEPIMPLNNRKGPHRGRRRFDEFQESRTVLRLALMYIMAFFLTWIWVFMVVVTPPQNPNENLVNAILYGNRIFLPSQGFLNALIFVCNKVNFARQAIPNISFLHALKMVIVSPSDVPEAMVSSLDVVHEDRRQREEHQRIQELELIDLEKEQNDKEEEEEEERDEVSALFPVSMVSSNFPSCDTPSFALSNALSSQGIDKKQEEKIKRDGDPNDTRQFYAATPKKYLNFSGDTLAAAWTLDQNSSVHNNSLTTNPRRLYNQRTSSLPEQQHGRYDHTRIAVPTSEGQGSTEGNGMSGVSSVHTSKSLLSGFSSALADPSFESQSQGLNRSQSYISEEGMGEVDASGEEEGEGYEGGVKL